MTAISLSQTPYVSFNDDGTAPTMTEQRTAIATFERDGARLRRTACALGKAAAATLLPLPTVAPVIADHILRESLKG